MASLDALLTEQVLLPYGQKFKRAKKYLQDCPEDRAEDLKTFLEVFPFATSYWFRLLENQPVGSHSATFRTALTKAPKSFLLWQGYLQHLRINEPQTLAAESSRALSEIGLHVLSGPLYILHLRASSFSFEKQFQFLKKAASKPIVLSEIIEFAEDWLKELKPQQLSVIHQIQHRRSLQEDVQAYRSSLAAQISGWSSGAKGYRQERVSLRTGLVQQFGQGGQEEGWLSLLQTQRQGGSVESQWLCYEEMLMALSDKEWLWEEFFSFLEYRANNYQRVLFLCRNNSSFFIHLSPRLCYHWCDLEERDRTGLERELYPTLARYRPQLETYFRHINYELRAKDTLKAKAIFDSVLATFSHDQAAIVHTVLEYAVFVRRHFSGHSADLEFPRKLLLGYLTALPYDQYLFLGSLQFFKQDTRKANFQQLSGVVSLGLQKARSSLNKEQLDRLCESVKMQMRRSLGHIQLIGLMDKRIEAVLKE